MFTPHRSAFLGLEPQSSLASGHCGLTLKLPEQTIIVSKDGFTIGSNPRCDLIISDPNVPSIHSIIHLQGGAIWIEGADDSIAIIANDRPYRRMALRHDDHLRIGSTEIQILITDNATPNIAESAVEENLAQLTAEELCDRILSEQAMVGDFVKGQRRGWEALLRAIEASHEEPTVNATEDSHEDFDVQQATLNSLLEQINELNQTLNERNRQLAGHENEILESTSQFENSQQDVQQRIDTLLDQLKSTDPPSDLRASA